MPLIRGSLGCSLGFLNGWRIKLRVWLLLFLVVLGCIVLTPWLAAETGPNGVDEMKLLTSPTPPVANPVDGFPALLDGRVLFTVRVGVPGVTSAAERAQIISQRIQAIAQDSTVDPNSLRVITNDNQSIVQAGDVVLFTVRDQDGQAYDLSHPELAAKAVERIRAEMIDYRERRSLRRLLTGLAATILSTLAFFMFLRGLLFFTSKLLTQIRQQHDAGTLGVRFQSTPLLGAGATSYLLSGMVRLLRIGLTLLSLYLYAPFVLSQFPATESVGDKLLQHIAGRLSFIAQGFVAYLPKLVTLAVLVIITYFIIEFAKQVIKELGRHDVYPWFYPEWVQPTIRLVSLMIVAIAFVVAGPYLPGFGSPAFQGISIFLGALLTLGSSSAVANAVSGIILIYTRAFQLGDFIRINDTIGAVQDKSLFVTRLLTPKQETVTIPNAAVLNSNVTNYSAICRESHGYLVLHTTITLGYDVPWRKIHEVLMAAARATPNIQHEPAPFVLQTNLNDFNVSYELNAFTAHPEKMPVIYSELHQNIQDHCNEAGIEILSPTYSSLRDGNSSTIPADYLPEDYTPPAFGVRQANGQR